MSGSCRERGFGSIGEKHVLKVSGTLKTEWAGRDGEPPITSGVQAALNSAWVRAGVGRAGAGAKAREPGSGSSGPQREGRREPAEGRAWRGRVRDTGHRPAAQGARRAPGLFREQRGGAGRGAGLASCLGEGTCGGSSRGADWRPRRARCCRPR